MTNTPDVLTDATAEIGMLLILGACRRASEGIDDARESNWQWKADYLIGKQLTGSRLGILGMGRIGQKIAKKLLQEKVKNIESLTPQIISTGNIGCITQISNGTNIPILHTIELLDWFTGGPRQKILGRI